MRELLVAGETISEAAGDCSENVVINVVSGTVKGGVVVLWQRVAGLAVQSLSNINISTYHNHMY